MRVVRMLLLLQVIAFVGFVASNASAQCSAYLGQCQGYCGEGMFCQRYDGPLQSFCGCKRPGEMEIEKVCRGIAGPMPGEPVLLGFDAELVGSEGGGPFLSPGNSISLTQHAAVTVRIQHDLNWCQGCQQTITVPAHTLRLVLRFDHWDPDASTRLWFTVTSLSANIPSFSSDALGGGATGDNVFSMLSQSSQGYIDAASGDVAATLYAKFFNAVFVGQPAQVQVAVSGHFDPATRTVSASMGSTDTDFSVIANGPGEDTTF